MLAYEAMMLKARLTKPLALVRSMSDRAIFANWIDDMQQEFVLDCYASVLLGKERQLQLDGDTITTAVAYTYVPATRWDMLLAALGLKHRTKQIVTKQETQQYLLCNVYPTQLEGMDGVPTPRQWLDAPPFSAKQVDEALSSAELAEFRAMLEELANWTGP